MQEGGDGAQPAGRDATRPEHPSHPGLHGLSPQWLADSHLQLCAHDQGGWWFSSSFSWFGLGGGETSDEGREKDDT